MSTALIAYCAALTIGGLTIGTLLGIVLGVHWVRRFELPTVRQEGIVRAGFKSCRWSAADEQRNPRQKAQ